MTLVPTKGIEPLIGLLLSVCPTHYSVVSNNIPIIIVIIYIVFIYDFVSKTNGKIVVNEIKLSDLDVATIFPVLDPQLDYVTISGAVFRPGKYALEKNLNIKELIHKSQGYLPDAHLEKADLTRTHRDGQKEHIDINLLNHDLIVDGETICSKGKIIHPEEFSQVQVPDGSFRKIN